MVVTGYGQPETVIVGKNALIINGICTTPENIANVISHADADKCKIALSGNVANGKIHLDWSYTGALPLSGFNIYRSESIGYESKVNPLNDLVVSGNSYEDLTAEVGKTYYYQIMGVFSDKTITWMSNDFKLKLEKPKAPTGLNVIVSNSKANLTWKIVTGATSYKVYYKRQNSNYKIITTKTPNLQISNLSKSTKYYFKVAAISSVGEGSCMC